MTRELADFYQEVRRQFEIALLRTKLPAPFIEDLCLEVDKRIAERYEREEGKSE